MFYLIVAVLLVVIVLQLVFADRLDNRRRKYADELCNRWIEEREVWSKERQRLLDRIQAPTFAEYKQAEVKVIRAQNGEKPPQPLEPL